MGMALGVFIIGSPIAILAAILVYLPIAFINSKKKGISGEIRPSPLRHLEIIAFISYIFLVIYATILVGGVVLGPNHMVINFKPFMWLTDGYSMGFKRTIEQVILNVLMFVPIGMMLPISVKKLRSFGKAIVVCFSFTLFIEIFQYFVGRSTDIDDVIMNFLGASVGYAIFVLLNKFLRKSKLWNKILGDN